MGRDDVNGVGVADFESAFNESDTVNSFFWTTCGK